MIAIPDLEPHCGGRSQVHVFQRSKDSESEEKHHVAGGQQAGERKRNRNQHSIWFFLGKETKSQLWQLSNGNASWVPFRWLVISKRKKISIYLFEGVFIMPSTVWMLSRNQHLFIIDDCFLCFCGLSWGTVRWFINFSLILLTSSDVDKRINRDLYSSM